MRPHGAPALLEKRRRAVALLAQGLSLNEVARRIGCHASSVMRWRDAAARGGPLAELCRRHPRLHLEPLPAYAPELNPDEGVWSHLKRALANGRSDTLGDLARELRCELDTLARSQRLLRGCIRQSSLPFFLP